MPPSSRESRVRQLDEALGARGALHLRSAAELLGVSEMTVRRLVASHTDVFAYLGGHILRSAAVGADADYVLAREVDSHAAAKAAACEHAVKLIEPEDTVFIDCGTALEHLAKRIPGDLPLTAVCYSLGVANLLAAKPACRLFMLGGLFHPVSASFGGPTTSQSLASLGITKAFISAGGVDNGAASVARTCTRCRSSSRRCKVLRRATSSSTTASSTGFVRRCSLEWLSSTPSSPRADSSPCVEQSAAPAKKALDLRTHNVIFITLLCHERFKSWAGSLIQRSRCALSTSHP